MAQQQDQSREYAKKYGQIVAKAWEDDAFKERLRANPTAVLQEEGLGVPAGAEVKMVELQRNQVPFVLPPKPSGELSDEQLSQVAGGCCCTAPARCGGCIMSFWDLMACVSR